MQSHEPCDPGLSESPYVSVIIPCLNEREHIETCIESVMRGDYPPDRFELLVVDGMSDDGTRPILESLSNRYPILKVIDNPKKIQSVALNLGISHARGSVVVRMDAHCEYPANYVTKLVQWLRRSGADNVGGVWNNCPSADTTIAKAIAYSLSHPFGVGNAHYRIGTSAVRWVDTVPFGCYRREVFDCVGLYDEEMARNEDDEFNGRLLRQGGRILLVPDVEVRYYARESLQKLWRMSYQYGYFKPLVERKIGRVMTLRQIVPATFILVLAISGAAAFWSTTARCLFAGVLAAYLFAIAGVAFF
jgi:glycosyltransferase involved in cell wall biosynthesis